MGKKRKVSRKHRVPPCILVLVLLLLFLSWPAQVGAGPEGLVVSPGELVFTESRPEESQMENVNITINTLDESWAIFTKAEPEGTQYKPILDALYLRAIGETKEVAMKDEVHLLFSGAAGQTQGEFSLIVRPPWDLPVGTYRFHLRFAYQGGENADPVSIPVEVHTTVTVLPSFQLAIDVTPEAGLIFEVQGPPGRYPAQNTVTVSGVANVPGWGMVLRVEDLEGKRGGVIPNARLVVPVETGLRKVEYVSLKDGLFIEGGPPGMRIDQQIDELYLETLLEDTPDIYEGRLFLDSVYSH